MNQNPYIHLLLASWKYATGKRFAFVFSIVCFVFANAIMLLSPYLFGQVLNVLQKGGDGLWSGFVFYLALYAMLPLGFWIFQGYGRVVERTVAFHIVKNLKERLFEAVSGLPFSWHVDNHSGQTINKISKATGAIERFSDEHSSYVGTIVRFFGPIVSVLIISWYLGIAAVITGLVILVITQSFDKKLVAQHEQILEKEHRVAAILHDYVSNIRTVITLHFESMAKHELARKIMEILPFKRKNYVMNEVKWFSVQMLVAVMMVVIILVYGYVSLQKNGVILAGDLVMIYQYLEKFSGSFFNFAWLYESVIKMNTEYRGIEPIIEDYTKHAKNTPEAIPNNWKSIEIRDLTFRYAQDLKSPTLDSVSIRLGRGEKIAFVGESGSGKSSLLSIIKGLYHPDQAECFIDGKSISSIESLKIATTLIPQDPEIFENTMRYNITFGLDAPLREGESISTDEAIASAVKLSRFDSVVQRLPHGLETDIKEKWVNLSGGERQRLALARGLFLARNRDIILLDEPTSSVDPVNERAIYESIFREFGDKCIISAIHKLHLLPLFDTIYVFEHGKLIESGSFDTLKNGSGLFASMWEKYREEEVNSTEKA